ncbi:hypothetical protein LCL97_02420 [Seohaeicola saemankumensis]|nr:hypothetical protein [Seohaeicola saemankumensis]MCA0869670.1 hypothetical protein [Seohaeicola saemankumensis]
MKHLVFAAIAAAAGLFASAASAGIDPKSYDRNGNTTFERSELDRLKDGISALPKGPERTHYEERYEVLEYIFARDGRVSVDELPPYTKRATCSPSKGGFVLRDRISDKQLTGCEQIGEAGGPRYNPYKSGASLSYSDDSSAGGTALTVQAGIGYVFPWSAHGGGRTDGLSLTERGFALFLEADGTKNGNPKDAGTVRLGFKGEFVFGSEDIPALALDFVGYAQSDINLDGRAYGLQMGLTPYNAQAHINSWYGKKGENYYNFVIKPMLDVFHVDDAGTSALTAGESYAWLGGEFGAQFLAKNVLGNGMTASIGADAYWDLVSGQEAIDGYARLDVFVNPERTAAFRVEYRDGEPRTTLIERDALTVGLALAF